MRKLIGAVLVLVGALLAYRSLRGLDTSDRADLLLDGRSGEEPVLGYDGMDLQTVIPWLESADLDAATLQRIRAYEQRNRSRESVLEAIDDLLNE